MIQRINHLNLKQEIGLKQMMNHKRFIMVMMMMMMEMKMIMMIIITLNLKCH